MEFTEPQDYLNQHMPAEIAPAKHDEIYMASMPIYLQLDNGKGLLAPDNLVALSDEDLSALQDRIETRVIPQLEKDIASYEKTWLAGSGNLEAATAYTTKYEAYQDTLSMGLAHERYVVTLGAIPADEVADGVNGAIDDFSARALEAFEQAHTFKGQIQTLTDELDNKGVKALDYFQDQIDQLPENTKGMLRKSIEARLDEKVAVSPEDEPEIEAFKKLLDERIEPLSAAEGSAATPVPAAPAQQFAPGGAAP